MTVINIKPFQVCGPINNVDTYSDVTKKYLDHQEFKKTPQSKFVTSSILGGNIHVFYSETGQCVGVEVFPPLKLIWDDVELLSKDLKFIDNLFKQRNIGTEVSDSGIEIPSLGISLYSHDFDDSLCCSVDSVYVLLNSN